MWQRPLRLAARPPGATGLPKSPSPGRLVGFCPGLLRAGSSTGTRHGGDGGTVAAWGRAAPRSGVARHRPQARGTSGSSVRYCRGSRGHGSVWKTEAAAFDTNAGSISRSFWSTPGTRPPGQLSPQPGSTATISHEVLLSLSPRSLAGTGGARTLPTHPPCPTGKMDIPVFSCTALTHPGQHHVPVMLTCLGFPPSHCCASLSSSAGRFQVVSWWPDPDQRRGDRDGVGGAEGRRWEERGGGGMGKMHRKKGEKIAERSGGSALSMS